MPSACARSIAFCTMSTLSSSVGAMFTAASVMISGRGVAGHVHDEAMADAPLGANAGSLRNDRAHHLVGVQAALHQRLGLGLAHQRDCLGRRIVAVHRFNDREIGDVQPIPRRHIANSCRWTNQERLDQTQLACLDCTPERHFVAGMGNGCRTGGSFFAASIRRRYLSCARGRTCREWEY